MLLECCLWDDRRQLEPSVGASSTAFYRGSSTVEVNPHTEQHVGTLVVGTPR